jgi:DNA-binding MarR family transcriptional regulator
MLQSLQQLVYTNCCWENNKEVMLDTFITSRVRRKIIVVYAKYPDFKTHVRGLAKLIKEDAGNIQRELKRLEKIGFLISERQGNTKIYYTNKQFPIFKELQSIVLKAQRANQKRQQL